MCSWKKRGMFGVGIDRVVMFHDTTHQITMDREILPNAGIICIVGQDNDLFTDLSSSQSSSFGTKL